MHITLHNAGYAKKRENINKKSTKKGTKVQFYIHALQENIFYQVNLMNINNKKILLTSFRKIILITLALPYASIAAEPKFVMDFDECMIVIAPLYLTESRSIKTSEGVSTVFRCATKSKTVNCQLEFKDDSEGKIVEYEIQLNAPPILLLKLINGTENIIIDSSKNTAVLSSLILDTKYAGSKVCHGAYFTNAQLKNNEK